jgi:streptogrisin C
MTGPIVRALFLALALGSAAAASAQAPPKVQSQAEAIEQDAAQYARLHQVAPAEALRRLSAQQASVAATDAIAAQFSDRLAGISIEHGPEYRIVVLLAGDEPVAGRMAGAGGDSVPIVFRTGARVTRSQAIDALRRHLIDVRQELPGARGAGYDQATGEIVMLVRSVDAQRLGVDAIRKRAERVTGVPVRILVNDLAETNLTVAGGGPVEGVTAQGRRQRCTTGFVVTDGQRRAIATAAHCPDDLYYRTADGQQQPLPFIGEWGHGYQDVQINIAPDSSGPLFYADRRNGALRAVDSWRNLAGIRAGEFVCHWGESTLYSCGSVQLTDYAPPGMLCAGHCTPSWVTVSGPGCAPGDSGGPVFAGTVAMGILKGANRAPGGRCSFYYFMSTDFLPPGWSLLHSGEAGVRRL